MLADADCRNWAFGGGSAIAHRLRHRVSYDVDLFLTDAQPLGALSPRLNDRAAALARSYAESANGIKIVTTKGDIDFLVSRNLLADPPIIETIGGRDTPTHTNAEILAKKIEFRGFGFTHRDMFDLAVLLDLEPATVERALAACSQIARDQAIARIDDEIDTLAASLPAFVNPTPYGTLYIRRAPEILQSQFAAPLAEARKRKKLARRPQKA